MSGVLSRRQSCLERRDSSQRDGSRRASGLLRAPIISRAAGNEAEPKSAKSKIATDEHRLTPITMPWFYPCSSVFICGHNVLPRPGRDLILIPQPQEVRVSTQQTEEVCATSEAAQ